MDNNKALDPAKTLNYYIATSLKRHASLPALINLHGHATPYTYATAAIQIERFHVFFRNMDLKKGDRVAFCARNSAQWALAFLASVTYGAVAVPILNEFKPDTIHNLLEHSGSRILFSDDSVFPNLNCEEVKGLEAVVDMTEGSYELAYSRNKAISKARTSVDADMERLYPAGYTVDDINYPSDSLDELVLINYTSGSTGFSKGVMLTRRNIVSNLVFAIDHMPFLEPGNGILSMLPMAHMYGLLVELIFPFAIGAYIRFLGRTPSPAILLDAFRTVHPKLIITVPLVIEKIIFSRVMPELRKPAMRLALAIPGLRNIIYRKVRDKLLTVFGGDLFELIIGGSALNPDVEQLLTRIKFPFTVGYGMTECAPLIAYAQWDERRQGSCGRIVDRMEGRIESPDPINIPGELWVKGDNVMQGYYNNPEATEAVLNPDGWMNTGDICQMDKSGLLYIRGRNKSMILGPSGQNIYPEEIEAVLNPLPLVQESVVVDRDGKLIAIIHPDFDAAKRQHITAQQLEQTMERNVAEANKALPAYSRINGFEIREEPFEKTPKHSIKRYLYK